MLVTCVQENEKRGFLGDFPAGLGGTSSGDQMGQGNPQAGAKMVLARFPFVRS
jgi:hypothetical protein